MRKITNGAGVDTTLVVQNLLLQQNELHLATLYQIQTPYAAFGEGGDFTDPSVFNTTSYGGGLKYDLIGKFSPSTIKNDQIITELGLGESSCKVSWSPARGTYVIPTGSAYPAQTLYQYFQQGVFDNGCVRIWRCYMPTRGDANTLGIMPLFMGRIAEVDVAADWISINCKTYLDFLETQVPRYLIEPSNRTNKLGLISSPNAQGVAVVSSSTAAGTTTKRVYFGGTLQPQGTYAGMFVLISSNSGASILQSGNNGVANFIDLLKPLPFNPGTGVAFTIYQAVPAATQAGTGGGTASELSGFPYVPRPEDQF